MQTGFPHGRPPLRPAPPTISGLRPAPPHLRPAPLPLCKFDQNQSKNQRFYAVAAAPSAAGENIASLCVFSRFPLYFQSIMRRLGGAYVVSDPRKQMRNVGETESDQQG